MTALCISLALAAAYTATAADCLDAFRPAYPAAARTESAEGDVRVRFKVGPEGVPESIRTQGELVLTKPLTAYLREVRFDSRACGGRTFKLLVRYRLGAHKEWFWRAGFRRREFGIEAPDPDFSAAAAETAASWFRPPFGPLARQARIQADIRARFRISATGGSAQEIRVEGHPLHAGMVERYLKETKFDPSACGGANNQCDVLVHFVIEGKEGDRGRPMYRVRKLSDSEFTVKVPEPLLMTVDTMRSGG